jgi:Tfp pilus assembly pilus retraction ATPase PilT
MSGMDISNLFVESQIAVISSTEDDLRQTLGPFAPRPVETEEAVQIFIVRTRPETRPDLYRRISTIRRGFVSVIEIPFIPPGAEHSQYSMDSYAGFLEVMKREIDCVAEGISEWEPPQSSEIFTAEDLFGTIELMAFNGCSDLQIQAGREVMARNERAEMEIVQPGKVMPEAEILEFLREVTRKTTHFAKIEDLYVQKDGERIPNFERLLPPNGVNLVYSVISREREELISRLRINVHLALTNEVNARGLAVSIRKIPAAPLSPRNLNFNAVAERLVNDICQQALHRGLVLFVGPTGSGKTLAMAAVVNQLNERRAVNIITIEDPVEIIYTPKKANIQQIELGTCVSSFEEAGINALRQDPDVVVIGEIRDAPTAKVAVNLALTGHLVLGTMHAATTSFEAIQKLTEMVDQKTEIVGKALQAIVAQRLITMRRPTKVRLPNEEPGSREIRRLLAMEVCRLSDRNKLRSAVLKGELNKGKFLDSIGFAKSNGFCTTLEDSLVAFVLDGELSAEDALEFSENKTEFLVLISGLVRTANQDLRKLDEGNFVDESKVKFHTTVLNTLEGLVKSYQDSLTSEESQF